MEKIGFSTLALFARPFEEWLEIATADGFNMIEILCEGPYWPRILLSQIDDLEIFSSYDVDLFLHAPTVDLNPASVNPGIREETLKQLQETVELAAKIGAEAITTHPGLIRRLEDRLRSMGLYYSIETLKKAAIYAQDRGVVFSVENMPNRYAYFCNSPEEHAYYTKECDCQATLDLGHANTSGEIQKFLQMPRIHYYHLSDNNGEKDQHLPLGEGTLDLNAINGIDKVIIELNNYENVIKSRNVLLSKL
ncbi:MAG: sugar phosphate isomerase/epimerase family protein [Methanobacteriaceae archaeon]|nr:sugar phosphate isomerase/epimerase family protein [Methanobacteriaceae archaeon]